MLPYHGEVGGGHFVAERKGLLEFVVGGSPCSCVGEEGVRGWRVTSAKLVNLFGIRKCFAIFFFEGRLLGVSQIADLKKCPRNYNYNYSPIFRRCILRAEG